MKWIKPSGLEIETNDSEETIKYCKSLGWKEPKEIKKEEIKKEPKKKGK
jgi:hypothetical protein